MGDQSPQVFRKSFVFEVFPDHKYVFDKIDKFEAGGRVCSRFSGGYSSKHSLNCMTFKVKKCYSGFTFMFS